jgi:hypothetical protein
MRGKLGNLGALKGLNYGGYDDLFHLGCLWTLVLIGVGWRCCYVWRVYL